METSEETIARLNETIEVKNRLLEAYRLKLNHLEYEVALNNSYSNMSNLMLKKEAAKGEQKYIVTGHTDGFKMTKVETTTDPLT